MIDQTVYQVRYLSMAKGGPWPGVERVIPAWVLSDDFVARVANAYCDRRKRVTPQPWSQGIGVGQPAKLKTFQRLWNCDEEDLCKAAWEPGKYFHVSRLMLKLKAETIAAHLPFGRKESIASTISKIESGVTPLPPSVIPAAASIFGCDPEWLSAGRSSIAYCFAPEWYDRVSQEHPEWELGPAPSELKTLGRTISKAIGPADRALIAQGKKFIADCIPGYQTGAPEWMEPLVLWGISAGFSRPQIRLGNIPGLGTMIDDCADRQESLRALQAVVRLPVDLRPE